VLRMLRKKACFLAWRDFPARRFDRSPILHNRCDTWNIRTEVSPKAVSRGGAEDCFRVFAASRDQYSPPAPAPPNDLSVGPAESAS
jgi:hypothetical protein